MDRESCTSRIDVLERLLLDESAEPTNLPLSLLQDITNHFSLDHQIGSGGFAMVYKGVVGKGMVAVKKLSNTFAIQENKFHEEVKCLIKAKHKNIVRFLGYCSETKGKMEEYEGNLVMADQRNWLLYFECLGEDQTRSITQNLQGTLGYMDPEYLRSRHITFSSDIYSLGVIIMEILKGVRQYLEDEYVRII
ncbi:cysteine-rich receptor-like protein kinase 26 [Triticum dicoccoides]|uniref:cysteine-rich receptor-like protein kinase 26 n=1 Tax=Triticum dicoccoides TaxID=85692 RepID=UPI0018916100|nr:cysteine-rich receptor-like protein kinase 26 [Triticum dicoccoides]